MNELLPYKFLRKSQFESSVNLLCGTFWCFQTGKHTVYHSPMRFRLFYRNILNTESFILPVLY